jgi:membrane-associated phospholipid phosphatase
MRLSSRSLSLALLCAAASARAVEPAAPAAQPLALSPPAQAAAQPAPASRPMIMSTVGALGDFGLAPLHWDGGDWLAVGAVLGSAAVVWNNDVPLTRGLSSGDARKPWLDRSMPTVSWLGEGYMEALYAAALYGIGGFGGSRLRATSGEALQALAVVGVYSTVFKYAAWSNRPSQDDTQHKLFFYSQASQGMPSGHSFSAFAVAEVYGAEYGRWWTYPLAGLVAYSRIYNRAHFTSDVLVGGALGVATGIQVRRTSAEEGPPLFQWGLAPGPDATLMTASVRF